MDGLTTNALAQISSKAHRLSSMSAGGSGRWPIANGRQGGAGGSSASPLWLVPSPRKIPHFGSRASLASEFVGILPFLRFVFGIIPEQGQLPLLLVFAIKLRYLFLELPEIAATGVLAYGDSHGGRIIR